MKKTGPPLRGFVKPIDFKDTGSSWESLSLQEKAEQSIGLMRKPGFVAKAGKASGEDALMLKIEKEPSLAAEIVSTLNGRAAVVFFIEQLFRSKNAGRSMWQADRALKLFSFIMTKEEQKKIKDAKLDCIAEVISSAPHLKEEWLKGLEKKDKNRVEQKIQYYDQRGVKRYGY